MKILRYLQGTKDLMLTYWCIDTLEVVGSVTNYAGYIDDKKSPYGYNFMMAGGAKFWKSVK